MGEQTGPRVVRADWKRNATLRLALLSGWLRSFMRSSPVIRIWRTIAKFFHRKDFAEWFLAWEKRLVRIWRNPSTKKMIYLLILSLSLKWPTHMASGELLLTNRSHLLCLASWWSLCHMSSPYVCVVSTAPYNKRFFNSRCVIYWRAQSLRWHVLNSDRHTPECLSPDAEYNKTIKACSSACSLISNSHVTCPFINKYLMSFKLPAMTLTCSFKRSKFSFLNTIFLLSGLGGPDFRTTWQQIMRDKSS